MNELIKVEDMCWHSFALTSLKKEDIDIRLFGWKIMNDILIWSETLVLEVKYKFLN